MHKADQQDFLQRLEAEASLQAQLHQRRVLPAQLDVVTSFIGRYSWQTLVVVSGITAAVLTWGLS